MTTDGRTTDGRVLGVARRYEPALVAVVIVMVALLVAPRVGRSGAGGAAATPVPRAGGGDGAVTSTTSTSRAAPASPFPTFAALPPAVRPHTTPASPVPVTAIPTTTTTTAPPTPLRITESGWSGSDGGSPVAGADVPDGSLPVSIRLGQPDRRSYVRLAGSASLLTLAVTDDDLGSRFPENAAVWLCPIVDGGWQAAPAMADADAPAYDCTTKAVGRPGDDGWAFDFGAMNADPAQPAGFALVAADGAADFQILFDRGEPDR